MVHQLITIAEYPDPHDTVWSVFDRKLEAALEAVEIAVSIRLRPEMGHGMELIRWLEGWNLRFRQQNKTLISIAEDPAQQQCLELSHPNMQLVYISSINEIPKILLKMTQQHFSSTRVPPLSAPPPVAPDTAIPAIEMQPPVPAGSADAAPPAQAPGSSGPPVAADSAAENTPDTPEQQTPPSEIQESTPFPASVYSNGRTPPLPPEDRTPVTGSHHAEHSEFDRTGYNRTVGINKQVTQYSIIEISGEYRCNNCGATRMFCKGDVVEKCENRECASTTASFTLLYDLF
jgi:hypothetical protein